MYNSDHHHLKRIEEGHCWQKENHRPAESLLSSAIDELKRAASGETCPFKREKFRSPFTIIIKKLDPATNISNFMLDFKKIKTENRSSYFF